MFLRRAGPNSNVIAIVPTARSITPASTDPQAQAAPAVAAAPAGLSPAMQQYQQFKAAHPGYVLFFRMGDFYEMFWDDAKLAARVLGVTLTTRSRGGLDDADAIPMAGVPFHAVDGYLRRMIAAGHRVALCEQAEDPATAKGLIRREVVRLMTPGTLTDDPLLDGRSENHLAALATAITKSEGFRVGLAWADLSTGSIIAMSGSDRQVLDEVARLRPAEVLLPETPSGQDHQIAPQVRSAGAGAITVRPGWQFSEHHAREQLQRQWQVRGAGGFGFADDDPAVFAAAAVLAYLQETQKGAVPHLRPLRRHIPDDFLSIDPATWRSLEIDRTVRSGGTEGSLVAAIDQTSTAMGARLLRQWLRAPLRDVQHIGARQEAIAALLEAPRELEALTARLSGLCDIERIIARVAVSRASPRDLAALARTLAGVPPLIEGLAGLPSADAVVAELQALAPCCRDRAGELTAAIAADPASHLREGGVIAPGFDAELDRLRELETGSRRWLADYQGQLAAESGISSVKAGYNKVFGYYIEVTDAHRAKVPSAWTRKQTVKNAERYITTELKQFEQETLTARERAVALEQQLFETVRQALLPHVPALLDLAQELARLDVLAGLATLARKHRYCRPVLTADRGLEIIEGRHPVLEQNLGSEFVANDLKFLDDDTLHLITGPNMAGKSTFIRQTALIALLAQTGSYVPAKSATIGIADRLFARIGASDEIHGGQSTFMVEMTETAHILNSATDRSLVILDEIGRGTSTLDGLSLAWAISEFIGGELRCRTLFATHYHELTDLSRRFTGVRNFNVAVREWEDQVVFLHRIVEGGTDRSYGIHVARLAGVPKAVLDRARQLMGELAVHHVTQSPTTAPRRRKDPGQLQLFADPAVEVAAALAAVDLESLTAEKALEILRELRARLIT
jgi:DNA mismatch repair protein MutS